MPWGDPDIQGIWTSATLTTLDRPDELEDLVLTEEQVRFLEQYGEDMLKSIDDLPEGDLTAGEDVGGYNAAWLDLHYSGSRGWPRTLYALG